MKNVIITGATGMIGGIIMRHCLQHPDIKQVTSLVRRPGKVQHNKLKEIITDDFLYLRELDQFFEHQDIAFYCLGVYSGSVSKELFRTITVDYTVSFVNKLKLYNPLATFCFLSGQGADQSEKSRMMFARDKGAAENHLIKANFPNTFIFRPAYIYPVEKRQEPNIMYRMIRSLYPVFKQFYPKAVITSEQLGLAMFQTGLKGGNRMVLENNDIKQILS